MLNISWPFLIRRLGLPPVYVSSSQLWCSRGLWGSNVLTTLSAPPVSVVAFSIYVFHFSQQWFVCPQSFPGSGSFQMSQFFASGGQGIGVSASTSVIPMNIKGDQSSRALDFANTGEQTKSHIYADSLKLAFVVLFSKHVPSTDYVPALLRAAGCL